MTKKVKFRVKRRKCRNDVPTNRMLVDSLRYDLGLTGTKEGWSVGVCGACTVLMDGEMMSLCITLTVMVDGQAPTVEGLAKKTASFTPCRRALSSMVVSARHLHARPGGGSQSASG